MTELHVQRKRNHFSWLWAVLIIILAATGIYLYMHYKNPGAYPMPGKSSAVVTSGNRHTVKTFQS